MFIYSLPHKWPSCFLSLAFRGVAYTSNVVPSLHRKVKYLSMTILWAAFSSFATTIALMSHVTLADEVAAKPVIREYAVVSDTRLVATRWLCKVALSSICISFLRCGDL